MASAAVDAAVCSKIYTAAWLVTRPVTRHAFCRTCTRELHADQGIGWRAKCIEDNFSEENTLIFKECRSMRWLLDSSLALTLALVLSVRAGGREGGRAGGRA